MVEFDEAELARLRELADLRLGDAIDDPVLDELVQRAARELDMPLAAVSIVLDSAQYFIASHGLDGWIAAAEGTPREWSFCKHAVASRAPFIVEDATVHPLVRDNPLVRVDGVRSYVGVPLMTSRDQALGAVCVLDVNPRDLTAEQLQTLEAIARLVSERLEARRAAAEDE